MSGNATNLSEKKKFDELTVNEFYGEYVSSDKYTKLKKNAAPIISLFGYTYLYEHVFSGMKHVKNKKESSIIDGHQEHCMRLAINR